MTEKILQTGIHWIELSSWKTKRIIQVQWDKHLVIMQNFDTITAWDWTRKEEFEWKAKLSTDITSNIFEYLLLKWLPLAYQHRLSDNEMLAEKLKMIPLEVVYRFVATWSYIKREKALKWENATPDGTVLISPIFEIFYKNDVIVEETVLGADIFDEENNLKLIEKPNGKKYLNVLWRLVEFGKISGIFDIEAQDKFYIWVEDKEQKQIVLQNLKDHIAKYPFRNFVVQYRVSDPLIKLAENGLPEVKSNWELTLLYPDSWEELFYDAIVLPILPSWKVEINEVWEESFVHVDEEPYILDKLDCLQDIEEILKHIKWITNLTPKIFEALKEMFSIKDLALLDGKIEFWINTDWELKLWDVIDWDSCRNRLNVKYEEIDWQQRIVSWDALDKDWYRAWENVSLTKVKYEKLSQITKECLEAYREELKSKSTRWQLIETLKS